VPNYAPPSPRQITLSGAAGAAALEASLAKLADRLAPHDHVIGAALIKVLTVGEAGAVDEIAFADRVRAAFVELTATAATRERIAHMVKTGKPLRN
jgi:3-hydroxyacyl-CoA dehydrogenase